MGYLRFHLLGFPVIVQPGFWLLAILLGSSVRDSAPKTAMLVAALFVSILAHELGHALMARRYGQQPLVTLHMMGGLTSWRSSGPVTRKATILITLAGPAMGLLVAGVAIGTLFVRATASHGQAAGDGSELTWFLTIVAQLNLVWSLLNLLPVLPLDGGQVLAVAMGHARRRATAIISLGVGLLSAATLWWSFGLEVAAVILGVAGVSQFVAFHKAERNRPEAEAAAAELLRRAACALEAGNYNEAATLGRGALALSRDREKLDRAATLTAWAALRLDDVGVARALCEQLGGACDVHLRAAVLEAAGMRVRALELLRAARSGGDKRPDLAAQLVRLEIEAGDLGEAAALTAEIAEDVPSQDIREVARRVAAQVPSAAASLLAGLYDRDRKPGDAVLALRSWLAAGLDGEARAFLQAHSEDAGLPALAAEDPALAKLFEV